MIVPIRRLVFSAAVGLVLAIPPAAAPAQEVPKTEPAAAPSAGALPPASPSASVPVKPAAGRRGAGDPSVGRGSILKLFLQFNPMLWPLALCSVVTLGFALERLVALRRERVVPREFVNRFLERLSTGKLDRDRAAELCRANDSAVARVFAVVVGHWGQPAATIRQAVGYDAAGEVTDLKRNIRVLNGTTTLAPLLGLLGTVVGMIQSFDAIGGKNGTARGEALAHGISLALITTAFGLAIAVVSVVAYYYLLNRVDLLVRELDDKARRVIDLVAVEPGRPSGSGDRRPNFMNPGDHPRHESRTHRD